MELPDIFDLLSRMTAHVDSEIRHLSLKSLQQFIIDFPDRREDIIAIYIKFILTKVSL